MVEAQKTDPGKFSRSQVFDFWCKVYHKTYPSEEEKLRRFKYFNDYLDYVLPCDRPRLRDFSDLSPREARRPDPNRPTTAKQRRRLEREAERMAKELEREREEERLEKELERLQKERQREQKRLQKERERLAKEQQRSLANGCKGFAKDTTGDLT